MCSRTTRLAARGEALESRGQVRCAVAERSLELGIDVGAVDLVVQARVAAHFFVTLQPGRAPSTTAGGSQGRLLSLHPGFSSSSGRPRWCRDAAPGKSRRPRAVPDGPRERARAASWWRMAAFARIWWRTERVRPGFGAPPWPLPRPAAGPVRRPGVDSRLGRVARRRGGPRKWARLHPDGVGTG